MARKPVASPKSKPAPDAFVLIAAGIEISRHKTLDDAKTAGDGHHPNGVIVCSLKLPVRIWRKHFGGGTWSWVERT